MSDTSRSHFNGQQHACIHANSGIGQMASVSVMHYSCKRYIAYKFRCNLTLSLCVYGTDLLAPEVTPPGRGPQPRRSLEPAALPPLHLLAPPDGER